LSTEIKQNPVLVLLFTTIYKKVKIMKRYILAFTALIGVLAATQAQKKEAGKSTPPALVKAALLRTFPGATAVKWSKEEGSYEAEFKLNGKEMSADLDETGAILESEEALKIRELPAAALDYIKTHYKGAKISESARITKANGEVNYEAEVRKADVMFDKNGKFLKEVKK
jgi:hypothetical protein